MQIMCSKLGPYVITLNTVKRISKFKIIKKKIVYTILIVLFRL